MFIIIRKQIDLYFLVSIFLTFSFGCSNHADRYLIGNSVEQKLTIEECLEIYLGAECKGDKAILCLLMRPEALDPCIEWPEADCFAPVPEACHLEIDSITKMGPDDYHYYLITLRSKEDKEKIYYCSFVFEEGRLFSAEPLRNANVSLH